MLDIIKQRRWMILTIILLILLNIGLITAMVLRDKRPWDHNRRKGSFESFLQNELMLTPTQIDSFKAIRSRHFKAGGPTMRALRASMDLLVAEAFSPTPDTVKIQALTNQLGILHEKLDLSFYNHFAALSALCTPEQRDQLKLFARDLTRKMSPSRKPHNNSEMTPPPPPGKIP